MPQLARVLTALKAASTKATSWWGFFPTMVFLLARLAVLGVSYLALTWEPTLQRINLPREWVISHPSLDGLFRWDAGHYIMIATKGYDNFERTNFWPLYPLVCRFITEGTGLHIQASMLLVSNLASFISVLLVYRVVELVEDTTVARTAVTLFVAYPFAFFQGAGYPESMVVALTAGSVLLALKERHLLAGLVLALAVLTRHVAIVTGASLVAIRVAQVAVSAPRSPQVSKWWNLVKWDVVGLVLPFVAVGAYSYYLNAHFGDPLAFMHARKAWADGFTTIFNLDSYPVYYPSYFYLTVLMTLSAAGLVLKKKWLVLAPTALLWLGLVMMVSATGLGRHTASCWPAFIPLAWLLSRHQQLGAAAIAALAMFQGLFIFLFSHHYHVL